MFTGVPTFVTFQVQIADQFIFTVPVPFVTRFRSILVSHPVALSIGQVQVAALEIVNSFTAEETSVNGNLISSFKLLS